MHGAPAFWFESLHPPATSEILGSEFTVRTATATEAGGWGISTTKAQDSLELHGSVEIIIHTLASIIAESLEDDHGRGFLSKEVRHWTTDRSSSVQEVMRALPPVEQVVFVDSVPLLGTRRRMGEVSVTASIIDAYWVVAWCPASVEPRLIRITK